MYSRLYRVLTNPFGHIFQIDCPGKHCESCGGLGHQESSLRCALEEDMFLQSMSAIDFYCSIDKVKGVDGKDRVALVFDGKYLPHSEQYARSGKKKAFYTQMELDEVRDEWACHVLEWI
ncbi:cyanate hydratase [Prunus yedoensis var. nudiflora]|uniref:Cyanate hydratase n=1 Tax=Prunus yedoensis var. nudiflora TaxID=2094558 RepID=A0A314XQC9_PRUYE|nr:cyanate hydratase [Prunus yedoensis var. nudiflora]